MLFQITPKERAEIVGGRAKSLPQPLPDSNFLGLENILDEELGKYISDSSGSCEEPRPKSKGRGRGSAVVGLVPFMGRDNELFRVDLKNVNNLKKDLAPAKLRKRAVTIFLSRLMVLPCILATQTIGAVKV